MLLIIHWVSFTKTWFVLVGPLCLYHQLPVTLISWPSDRPATRAVRGSNLPALRVVLRTCQTPITCGGPRPINESPEPVNVPGTRRSRDYHQHQGNGHRSKDIERDLMDQTALPEVCMPCATHPCHPITHYCHYQKQARDRDSRGWLPEYTQEYTATPRYTLGGRSRSRNTKDI